MSNYMSKFAAKYSDSLAVDINEDLFDRRQGKQIYEYILEDLKCIEVIPNVRITSTEYVTDMSKIDVRLNRRNIKSKFILHHKIEKLIPIHQTAFDALKFTIQIGSQTVENTLLIPKYIDRYHFLLEGNKTLPMFQIVDSATYNQKGNIILRTNVSAKLSKEKRKLPLVDTESKEEFMVNYIILDLFKKKFNPLFYYAANMGILETISYFGYTKYLNVVAKVYDPELFYYFKVNSGLYIEAEKTLFNTDKFFKTFTGMFNDIFNSRNKLEDVMNQEIWVRKLGSQFTSSPKNQYIKGLDVLKSFRNSLDPATRNTLRYPEKDRFDTYSVLRLIMRDFNDIRNADNNDLNSCRIRVNEYIASYFRGLIKKNFKYALNMRPFDEIKAAKIFKFDEYSLLRMIAGGTKGCPLFRYNVDVNDLHALNGLKYSLTGIGGLPSDRITDEQRDLYPSHLEKLDPNSFSASSPGTSGMLTPFCKIYENGYFGELEDTGKSYETKLKKKIKSLKNDDSLYSKLNDHYSELTTLYKNLEHIVNYAQVRNEAGYIQLTRTKYERNGEGYIAIRNNIKYMNYKRNENGYIAITMKQLRPRIVPIPRPVKIIPKVQARRRRSSR